jgi:small subunit ribosomal protein S18
MKKKVCRFCADHSLPIDYKEPKFLSLFITDRGKIIPRRVTGNCAFHQRRVTEAVKRSRILALLPFAASMQV